MLKIREIVLIGMFSAIITSGKLALSFVPNIEIVTLLFIIYTISLGYRRTLLISIVFITTEIFIYGLSTWLLVYYIIWPLLIIITHISSKKFQSEYVFATISGLFGLLFGAFFAVFESFFYGWAYGFTYWLRGIPWDIVHGASNFIILLVLFQPLSKALTKNLNIFIKDIG